MVRRVMYQRLKLVVITELYSDRLSEVPHRTEDFLRDQLYTFR